MPEYQYPNDGKTHTRYSELVKCTNGQVRKVVQERFGELSPFSNGHTGLGQVRHDMFQDEITKTHRLPKCFLDEVEACKKYSDVEIDVVEKHYESEIFKNVVLHSTIDAASTKSGIIFDFKMTTQSAKKWASSKQILVYAYQLILRKVEVKTAVFLIERWNSEKTEILGYECIEIEITPEKVLEVKEWIKSRVELLLTEIKLYTMESQEKQLANQF
jgi:hypothetical protein